MFKGIISRDSGCPWGETGMSSAKWLDVPARAVSIADLHATQPGVYLHALSGETVPVGGDQLPHVIDWAGEMYLEDGHHRVIRALIAGSKTVHACVLHVPADTLHVQVETLHVPAETLHDPVDTLHGPVETLQAAVDTLSVAVDELHASSDT